MTGALRAMTGVLLAGGLGRRMGIEKARMQFRGRPLLPSLAERLASVCSGGVLVVRREAQEIPALPASARVVEDLLPGRAALGGLYTGLVLSDTPFVFCAACDLPLLDASLVRFLRDLPPLDADALVPLRDGRPEPLHAIYGASCLGRIKAALLRDSLRMDGFWDEGLKVERVEEALWRARDPRGLSMFNVNSPEELQAAEAMAVDEDAVTRLDRETP
jgi:molybdopterin-guanine dinucleotide biosynthesis protein A